MYLGTSPKQKTSIVVGITQCQSPYWTLNALHCVIYCHCWCYLWHGEDKKHSSPAIQNCVCINCSTTPIHVLKMLKEQHKHTAC